MSRGLVTDTDATTASASIPDPRERGLEGPMSVSLSTEADPRVAAELTRLLEAAREIRPVLRRNQAQTELDGQYGPEVHAFFQQTGFYRMLVPRRWGGLELTISAFYQVIAEVARGCPSTAWCLSLSTGHALTLASYWPEETQAAAFGAQDSFVAPASGNGVGVELERVDGGWLLSGDWRYCSGAPYSTHFMPTLFVPQEDGSTVRSWAVLPRESITVLDDWGRVIGMKGSGSNGIRIDRAFVPDAAICEQSWTMEVDGPTVGSLLHDNALYAGTFTGFSEGEVACTSVGLGYAAIDEYERIISSSRHPYIDDGTLRVDHTDWLQVLGMAVAKVDSAAGILAHSARLYGQYSERSHAGVEPFTVARTMRLSGTYFVIEQLVWEAVELLLRTAGSRFSADGERLQRYFRDILTTRTRTDQFEYVAPNVARAYLGASIPSEEHA